MVKASSIKDWENEIYHLPIYSVADASRYLHIPTTTLQTWLKGRSYPTKKGQKTFLSLIQRPESKTPQLSFTNLVEAHVLRVIRTVHNIPLDKVRIALDYLTEQFNTPHPLIQKQFTTDGVDLFIEQVEHLINVSRSGQLAIKKVLSQLLTRIEWDEKDIATKLFPFVEPFESQLSPPNNNFNNPSIDHNKIITISPNISFGKPTITGTGVPTKVIIELYNAGDSLEDIAEDYSCSVFQIEQAILFESNLRAA